MGLIGAWLMEVEVPEFSGWITGSSEEGFMCYLRYIDMFIFENETLMFGKNGYTIIIAYFANGY